MPKILIACIGNIFLGDDGFGVEVARRLAGHQMPEGVRVVDFGIRSYDLAYALMDPWDLVILADAVPRGGAPGTIYVIEPDPAAANEASATVLDAHTMNPVAVLQMVSAMGGKPGRMIVVGCEPSPVDPECGGMELSAPVAATADEAVRLIEELVTNYPVVATASSHQT